MWFEDKHCDSASPRVPAYPGTLHWHSAPSSLPSGLAQWWFQWCPHSPAPFDAASLLRLFVCGNVALCGPDQTAFDSGHTASLLCCAGPFLIQTAGRVESGVAGTAWKRRVHQRRPQCAPWPRIRCDGEPPFLTRSTEPRKGGVSVVGEQGACREPKVKDDTLLSRWASPAGTVSGQTAHSHVPSEGPPSSQRGCMPGGDRVRPAS